MKVNNDGFRFLLIIMVALAIVIVIPSCTDSFACVSEQVTTGNQVLIVFTCDGARYELTTDTETAGRFTGHVDGVYDVPVAVHGRGKYAYLSFEDIPIRAYRCA